MIGPVKKNKSPYRQNLKEMARMANYEPVASIQQPSQGFNYTMARKFVLDSGNRYSDYY